MSTELKKDGTLQLEIRREFPFPRDMVFDAWTNKDHLSKWMGPTPEITLALTEVDARKGGSYRFGFEEKDCSDGISYVHGEYLEISRPDKLVFTWICEPPLEEADIETFVTVEFFEPDLWDQTERSLNSNLTSHAISSPSSERHVLSRHCPKTDLI